MDETTATTTGPRGQRVAASIIAVLLASTTTAPASEGSLAWVVVSVMVGYIVYAATGSALGPKAPSGAPTRGTPAVMDLGGGWELVGAPTLAPIYVEALRAWCSIGSRWEPIWEPKRGGRKAGRGAAVLRPSNAAGTVNRLLSDWLTANPSRWSHGDLVAAMLELGIVDRVAGSASRPLTIVPLPAVNAHLVLRIAATVRRS